MPEITLVRQEAAPIAPQDAEAARRVIFGVVDGLGKKGRKQWRRLWNRIMGLEPGEMMEITTIQPRLGWFHRKHMALEQAVFESPLAVLEQVGVVVPAAHDLVHVEAVV